MAIENVISKTTTSHAEAYTGDYEGVTGTGAEIYDGDGTTGYKMTWYHGADGSCAAGLTSTHTWTSPITILKIKWTTYWNAIVGNYPSASYNFSIQVQSGGSWTTVDSHSGSYNGGVGATLNEEVNGEWTNVTGVQIVFTASAYSYEGDRWQRIYGYIYQLEAFKTIIRSFAGVV